MGGNNQRLGTGDDLRVWLTNRGATNLLAELHPDGGSFERVLSTTSDLAMDVTLGDGPACEEWGSVVPWATEILVIRDGRDAFAGPVTEAAFPPGKAAVTASDLTAWWDRRRTPTLKFTSMDPVKIVEALHKAAMDPDPIPNFNLTLRPSGLLVTQEYDAADHAYIADDIKELADSSVDWTSYGRAIIVQGDDEDGGGFIRLSDEMWSTPPTVKRRGNEQATRVIVKGKDGLVAIATASQEYLDRYGLLERVFEESGIADQATLDKAAQSRLALLKDPVYIETPTNATLRPSAPVTLDALIPGVRVRVDSRASCVPVLADFRLSKVKVDFGGAVAVDLQPLGNVDSTSTGG